MRIGFAKLTLAATVATCAACSSSSSGTTGTGATGGTSGTSSSGGATFYSLAGGAAGVQSIVSTAVTGLLGDCVEAPYFTSVLGKPGHHTASDLEACLNLFFSQQAVGGPNTYPGTVIVEDGGSYLFNPASGGAVCRDLTVAHNGLGIPPAVFDQFLTDLEGALPAAVTGNATVASQTVALLESLEPQISPSYPDAGAPVSYYFACAGGASFDGGPTKASIGAGSGSLFDKYGYAGGAASAGDGGIVLVQEVVGQAVAGLAADCVEAPYFTGVFDGGVGSDSPSDLEGCLEQFFNYGLGGPASYPSELASGHQCVNMTQIHAGLGITAPVFTQFVTDLGGVLTEDGMASTDVTAVATLLGTFSGQVEADAGANNPAITNCTCDFDAGYSTTATCNGLSAAQ